MRADVSAERQRFRRRAGAYGRNELTMLLHQAEQVGRMHGMVRHTDEIRLREIVDFGGLDELEEVGSHVYRGYRRVRGVFSPVLGVVRIWAMDRQECLSYRRIELA